MVPHLPTAHPTSSPVLLPLIGLTYFTQYLVTYRANPGEMCEKLQGATGHSQGAVSAVVATASTSIKPYFGPKHEQAPAGELAAHSLSRVRAPSGLDQSKTPFSQCKLVFSARFLGVGVPYHSDYLRGMTEKIFEEDLAGEEPWKKEGLGADLRELTMSVTRSLDEQISTRSLHWAKATNLPETTTRAIAFGSRVGPMTVRNLNGRGKVQKEERSSKDFMLGLMKTSDGKIHLNTAFSRLLGKPPIMVAGMIPTTVKAGFVSAILAAGYHELAGGGHYNAAALREKFLWQELCRESLPIEGFSVAAGIPSTEKAAEIAASRPSSYPSTGTDGRTGGHHSYVDFHQPILSTYSCIRQHANLSLVAGSGFGGADDVWPYLTGGANTSVKDLIVSARGVDDAQWEGTYAKETGGILTVKSELGEPIHKEFDETVFRMPKEKRAAWLAERRAEIIAKLNKDFAKPQ
ncbi:hypothetical protein FOMPIDRAFT_93382 [Fomitopsis schrenkii]|uniref:Fatty acid synthase beta subunit AflB /Fas1-like central domain-containing protein n=1 Tax=Fomitopsis schrenkii TaxID=2126942 RepID=S8EWU0_FOMSC|nr:hypothetical protein FOMPIDRAFT_93382 [Fomitopsis schrenkii]